MFCAIILLLLVNKCEPRLKFFDEFDENGFIDENKWKVEHEVHNCNGNYINQLNCKTNDKNNLRVIDGTLALAAIRHKHANKFYTSPMITTKQSFKYGRFEIRAALPKGKMLRPIIFLLPTQHSGQWPKDGEIDILYNHQTPDLIHGLQFMRDNIAVNLAFETTVEENLNDFNTYILDWSETELKFIFNEKLLHSIKTTKELENNYNPFDKRFKLSISLGIGGFGVTQHFFPGQTLYESDVKEWNCSLLILDYIRIYGNDQEPDSVQSENKNVTSSEICANVMPLIRLEDPKWELIFNDEFNYTGIINQQKWIVHNELEFCDGNDVNKFHCNTNNTRNVRLTDSTLVLAAIREKYSKRKYTSPLITTKENFTYGRFEIRAALPKGKMLRPAIYLESTDHSLNNNSKEGLIDIVTNTQLQEFYYGTHLNNKTNYVYRPQGSQMSESLFQFHTYILEWTQTEIRWYFDDNPLSVDSYQKELYNNIHSFDRPFKLVISLGVGEKEYFPDMVFNEQDADEWPCSLFILDYVRVFKLSDKNIPINNSEINQNTSSDICQNVMAHIRYSSKNDISSVHVFAVIFIISFSLLLAIIFLIIIQLNRSKNMRKTVFLGDNQFKFPRDNFEPNLHGGDPAYFDACDNWVDNHNNNECLPLDDMKSYAKDYEIMTDKILERQRSLHL